MLYCCFWVVEEEKAVGSNPSVVLEERLQNQEMNLLEPLSKVEQLDGELRILHVVMYITECIGRINDMDLGSISGIMGINILVNGNMVVWLEGELSVLFTLLNVVVSFLKLIMTMGCNVET